MIYATPFGSVDIPIKHTSGISASGGADSTILLLCMVLQGMRPRIFFLNDANSKFAALVAVVAYINSKFSTQLVIERVDRIFIPKGNNIRPEIMGLSSRVDYLYTGVTKNPPIEIGGMPPNRPKGLTPSNFIMPFLNLDKRASLYLFGSMGVQDLLDLTYTCTQDPVTPCAECFACREKT